MSHTRRVTVAKLTCNNTHTGRNLSTDLSRPKLELIPPSKVSPLEMITACLCFRIQETVRNRLIEGGVTEDQPPSSLMFFLSNLPHP